MGALLQGCCQENAQGPKAVTSSNCAQLSDAGTPASSSATPTQHALTADKMIFLAEQRVASRLRTTNEPEPEPEPEPVSTEESQAAGSWLSSVSSAVAWQTEEVAKAPPKVVSIRKSQYCVYLS